MLPVMRRIAGETYTCSNRTAHQHITVLARQFSCSSRRHHNLSPPDLWPPNSPDLNPVDYRIWGWMEERVYKTLVRDTNDWKERLND